MRRPPITTKPPGEGVPRTWSSPELEIAAEVLKELQAAIRALELSNGSSEKASALAQAAASLARLQNAAGALASDDERLTDKDVT
jgi:hypothetical protein